MKPKFDSDEGVPEKNVGLVSEEDKDQTYNQAEDDISPEKNQYFSQAGCLLVSAQIFMLLLGFCSDLSGGASTQRSMLDTAIGGSATQTYLVVTTIIGVLLLAFLHRGQKHNRVALFILPVMFMLMALVLIRK